MKPCSFDSHTPSGFKKVKCRRATVVLELVALTVQQERPQGKRQDKDLT
jgi:hypothetical protein